MRDASTCDLGHDMLDPANQFRDTPTSKPRCRACRSITRRRAHSLRAHGGIRVIIEPPLFNLLDEAARKSRGMTGEELVEVLCREFASQVTGRLDSQEGDEESRAEVSL